jgi:predicted nucleic acid-binding protein
MSRKEFRGAASHVEPAVLGVILDSSIVIEGERRHLNVAQFLKVILPKIGETEVALCAITVAELAHGIYRAGTPERHQRRRAFLDDWKAAGSRVPDYRWYRGVGGQDRRGVLCCGHNDSV